MVGKGLGNGNGVGVGVGSGVGVGVASCCEDELLDELHPKARTKIPQANTSERTNLPRPLHRLWRNFLKLFLFYR